MNMNIDDQIAALDLRRRQVNLAYAKGLITLPRLMAEHRRIVKALGACVPAEDAPKPKRPIDDAGRARSAEVRESMAGDDAKWVLAKCIRLGLAHPDGGRVNCQLIAEAFNTQGFKTPRGKRWTRAGIRRALERAGYRFRKP